ncbi:murein biosynthesis integral membrane protein MurJ [Candidatus Parcubacteria bacterium]|nr:MAG: murein biosynthesis integral membrane protein MurJ [Candidatus Parcubacteria bacterium]
MWQKLWHKINNTVTGGAFLIAFFSFLSKLFALFRERLIAHNFGAGELSDIYYSAFRLPDLIFNTLVLGALTSAFIPVFQKVWNKDKEQGIVLANSVMNFFLITVALLVIIAYIFAPQIVPVFTPGFSAWQLVETVTLTRIMLLAIIFFVASNVIGGVLNSWKKFFSFSLAASFYNIGIIVGIVWFYPYFGLSGLAWGVFLGAILHLLVQLPEALKHGWHYNFSLKFDHSLRKILKLMLPRTIGLAAGQFNLVIITMIASTLSVGSIAVFNLANNLQSLPISLFAVSLAIAVFPTFTQAVNENNSKLFAENFSISFRRILFLVIPISILILVLRAQIVRVILGSGAFNWENTKDTAQTLGLFALSMFAQGLIPLLARSFYAHEDTKTPMLISIFSIAVNILLSWWLAQWMGVMGLALAFSISSIINMLLLYVSLHLRVHDIDDNKIFKSLLMISLNGMSAGAICYAGLYLLAPLVNMQTFWGIFTQGVGAGLLGLLTYLILSILFKLEEVEIFRRLFKKFCLLFSNGKH